jgi:protein involved in polysaccharide export with SLBB domain
MLHYKLLVLLFFFSLSACAVEESLSPQIASIQPEISESTYLLGTGDKVNIKVFRENNLSGDYQIDDNGTISFPLIGVVDTRNVTARGLEQRLKEKLSSGFLKDPVVTVQVLSYRPFYILGEVKNPGSYPYVTGITIENAVALAGGYSYRGRKDVAIVTHASDNSADQTVPVGTKVLPGDVITIKERYF